MVSTGPSGSDRPAGSPSRRRLSRTFARSRWPEYGRLLKAAIGLGYQAITLESFLDGAFEEAKGPVLILRHDVDQHAPSALEMSDVEVALGLRSTWYLRWRTARTDVVEELRRRGGEIGFHYETVSRAVLEGAPLPDDPDERLRWGREALRDEIASFAARFGPIRSVAAHGDTRAPGIRNGDLMRGEEWSRYGVDYDANDALRRHRLAAWVTDRSSAEGGWSAGDPVDLLRAGESPILCLTHPNNWVSGPALWGDRLSASLRRVSDAPPADGSRRSTRTG
ncbi:MAG TPA: hypothetical protein VFJ99_05605 [Solirubrobacterales bacterium]|nr:hypothetical protein [Solirubrobacterales bacterium]